MKALIFSMLLLISCGKTTTVTIEKQYDDSALKAYELIQDARIKALESKAEQLETLVGKDESENAIFRADIQAEFDKTNAKLTSIQSELTDNTTNVVNICNSGENLIKIGNNFYAVYMVSNNYGTYLGKLSDNVLYQTTDFVRVKFKINKGVILCQ